VLQGRNERTAVLTELSASDCSKPAQKAAVLFSFPLHAVELSMIG